MTTPMILQFTNVLNITLPLTGSGIRVLVDWGDNVTTTSLQRTYSSRGNRTVQIRLIDGNITEFGSFGWNGSAELTAITQWGDWPNLTDLRYIGGAALNSVPSTFPSTVRNVVNMFNGASSFNQNLSTWDVSQVIYMSSMFSGATIFNQPLSTWVVSQVQSMSGMFSFATSFNKVLDWNVSQVTNMEQMFRDATAFNQDISSWDVRQVRNMINMFYRATSFSAANYGNTLIGWAALSSLQQNVQLGGRPYVASQDALGAVETLQVSYNWVFDPVPTIPMILQFANVRTIELPLNDPGIEVLVDWGDGTSNNSLQHTYDPASDRTVQIELVAGTLTMFGSFQWPGSAELEAITQWGNWPNLTRLRYVGGAALISVPSTLPSTVRDVYSMFREATSFNQDISAWNVSLVQDMGGMFTGATRFNKPLSTWNVGQVQSMVEMFLNATSFNKDLSAWNVRLVENMFNMFDGATSFSAVNYGNTLIGWAALSSPQQNVELGGRPYVSSQAALGAYNKLQDEYSWVITPTPTLRQPMILQFEGVSTITLPLSGFGIITVSVDWGDGNSDNLLEHTYDPAGDHTVQIELVAGTLYGFGFDPWPGSAQLTAITQWGDWPDLTSLNYLGGAALISVPSTLPSTVLDLANMFNGATNFNEPLDWDVSQVQDMTGMFSGAISFNKPLDWTVSQVINMNGMFLGATSFNQNLSTWDVGQVQFMLGMFLDATSFSAANYGNTLIGWAALSSLQPNVPLGGRPYVASQDALGAVETLQGTYNWVFDPVPTLRQPMILEFANVRTIVLPLSGTDITVSVDWGDGTSDNLLEHTYGSVGDRTVQIELVAGNLSGFGSPGWSGSAELTAITQWGDWPNLNSLNYLGGAALISVPSTLPSTVLNVRGMFQGASSFDQDISAWNVSLVQDMAAMFNSATSFNKPLNWNVSNVTNMFSMFATATSFNKPLNWNVGKVTSMYSMFYKSTSFDQDISAWNVSLVQDMGAMFQSATSFNKPLNWNVSTVTNMTSMFLDAVRFNQRLNWDVSKVITMGAMFRDATSFNKPLNWNVSKVETMSQMFLNATNFNQDLSAWDVGQVQYMLNMFDGATSFSAVNYGNTLIGWAALSSLQPNVQLSGRPYVASQDALSAYNKLQNDYSWVITPTPTLRQPMILEFTNVGTIELPLSGTGITVSVDWGDGNSDNLLEHTYDPVGNPTVQIELVAGTLNGFGSFGWNGSAELTAITQWGNWPNLTDLNYLGGAALIRVPSTLPSTVRNVANMFSGATSFNEPLDWDVSLVQYMGSMFREATRFNQPLDWDVRQVLDMNGMFAFATSFNRDLSAWNVQLVEFMAYMFRAATSFSPVNYGNTLIGWAALSSLQQNVELGGRPYVSSQEALDAVETLQDRYNWVFDPVPMRPPMILQFANVLTITLPLIGTNIEVLVDWGDGTSNNSLQHSYASAGDRTVQIELVAGTLNGFGSFQWNGSDQLRAITQWGNWPNLTSLNYLGGAALISVPSTLPSTVRYLDIMFGGASNFNQPLSTWDVSQVQDMTGMFAAATSFNQDLSAWNVSEVLDMTDMFDGATSFSAVNYGNTLIGWAALSSLQQNVQLGGRPYVSSQAALGAVETLQDEYQWVFDPVPTLSPPMILQFEGVSTITLPLTGLGDIEVLVDWGDGTINNLLEHTYAPVGDYTVQIGLVAGTLFRFGSFQWPGSAELTAITQWGDWPDLTDLIYLGGPALISVPSTLPSTVRGMNFMFFGATSFDQPLNWDVSQVQFMSGMFFGATRFNRPLNWNVGQVLYMASMFREATSFNQPLDWDVSQVQDMNSMFYVATSFNQDLSAWDVSQVRNMTDMFNDASSFSAVNYGNTLIGWAALDPLQPNVPLGSRPYVASQAALNAVGTLQVSYNWVFDPVPTIPMILQFAGVSTITLPLTGTGIEVLVDWGDGNSDNLLEHTYDPAGNYTVQIGLAAGTLIGFGSFSFQWVGSAELTAITQWGDWPDLTTLNRVGGAALISVPLTLPSTVQNMSLMFYGATRFNQDISAWDVSKVQNMTGMFYDATTFDKPLDWDVGQVQIMGGMFYGATTFDQPLNWNVSQVQFMSGMFQDATSFNQPLIWNVGQVINMSSMFQGATSFDQPLDWDVRQVRYMSRTFYGATSFDQDLSAWDVHRVLDMTDMFTDATSFSPVNYGNTLIGWAALDPLQLNVPLGGRPYVASQAALNAYNTLQDEYSWVITPPPTIPMILQFVNVSRIELPLIGSDIQVLVDWGDGNSDALLEHSYASAGDYTVDILLIAGTLTGFGSYPPWIGSAQLAAITQWGNWPDLTNLNYLGGAALISVPSNLPSTVLDVSYMFYDASNFNQVLDWDVSKVETMTGMFAGAISFNQDLSAWDVGQVQYMNYMFIGAISFNKPLNWDVSQVGDMNYMFNVATSFNQPLNWDVSQVGDMRGMFFGATSFNQPLDWDVSQVQNMSTMFAEATSFNQPLNWDVSQVRDTSSMFGGATSFNQPLNWNVGQVRDTSSMFGGATSFNQPLNWDVSLVETMAFMFFGATSFNQDLSAWNVGQVVSMFEMFRDATSFNQDLTRWNVSQVRDMTDMFTDAVNFSATNYSNILIRWLELPLKRDVPLGGRPYVDSQAALDAYNRLESYYGWKITPVPIFLQPLILQFVNVSIITLPLFGSNKTVSVDWGDNITNDSESHTYAIAGNYTVQIFFISGTITGFGSMNWEGSAYLSEISGWDNLPGLINLNNIGGAALIRVPNSLPSTVTNIDYLFLDATQFNQNISTWDVSRVLSMSSVFLNASAFNQPLESWQVGNATNMLQMFQGATSFNQPLNGWDVRQVIIMQSMFYSASMFNQPLNRWRVGNVVNMARMFSFMPNFNQDLSSWDVRQVTNMTQMFDGSPKFNQPLNSWQVGNVANMSFMFKNASSFNQDLSAWQVGNVANMSQMFNNASSFNQDLSAWQVGNVANMSFMFRDAVIFNQPLNTWNVGKVVTMASMFDNAINFNQPLNNWDVSQVVNMSFLFFGAEKFNQDLSAWNVSRVIDMRSVFSQASTFNQDLSSWDVSSATQMSYMFYQCSSFNQNLGNWNVSKVTTMDNMFTDAASFDVSNYSATLTGWAALPTLQINVPLTGGSALYEAARAAYTHLITAPYIWQITPVPTFLPTPALSVEYNQSTTRAYRTNSAIIPYQPTVYSTYSDVFFSITPALPSGLIIDASNGTISGTPAIFSLQTTYTVNATANAGQYSVENILRFSVSSDFYYPSNSVFLNDIVINPLEPTVAPGITITGYAITPNLSNGLIFNIISGAITGTPRDASLNQIYTITGTKSNGTSLPYMITLNVVDISYANVPYIYAQNAEFLYSPFEGYPIIPTRYDAAFFNSLILKTPLPVELAIDLSDGIIYGIPYTATPPKNYILTATTMSGYTKDITLNITVNGFSYTEDGSEPVYSLNVYDTVKIMLLINVGGYTDFIVTPKLPAGLTLDSATGTISGTVKEQFLSDEAYFISGLVDPIITIPITIIIKAYNPPVCEYKCPPRVIIPRPVSSMNTNTMRYSTLVRTGLGQTRFIANSGTNINGTYTEPIRNKF